MKRADFFWLGFLVFLGTGIWLRDRAWAAAAGEVMPILVALPLFVWLGSPWRLRVERFHLHQPSLVFAVLLFGLGCALDLTFFLAAAWTLALWSWLRARADAEPVALRRLTLLPLMAFPWLALDFASLGWWYRLTGAWSAEWLYGALGLAVHRQGTNLLVQGLPIEVAAACSGMNALQTILIAGVALLWLELRGSRWFWPALVTLPALAWLANALRICATVAVALSWGEGFARGHYHEAAGWLILMAVMVVWWLLLGFLARRVLPQASGA